MIGLQQYLEMLLENDKWNGYDREFEEIWTPQIQDTDETSFDLYIKEHLKNIDPKFLKRDFELNMPELIDNISVDGQIITIIFNDVDLRKWPYKSCKDDIINKVKEMLHVYLYVPKNTRQIGLHKFKTILEPMYPEVVGPKDCYFHITDRENANRILKSGLRPRYNRYDEYYPTGKESPWRKYKKDSKNEQYSKVYLFYINDRKSNVYWNKVYERTREVIDTIGLNPNDTVLLDVYVPRSIPLYKDITMQYVDNCCFSYVKIDPKYIKEESKFKYFT